MKSHGVRFVIFAAPRTGSNFLCGLLNSHRDILCHHGLFNPAGIHYALDHREGDRNSGASDERDRQPKDFIDRIWREDFGKTAIGFKFNRGENDEARRIILDDAGVRKILLTRRNRVKTYVSELIAMQTGQWESYCHLPENPANPKIYVDQHKLYQHINLNERFYSELEETLLRSGQSFLHLQYEVLLPIEKGRAGNPNELARILSYLDQQPSCSDLTPASRKQNPDDLRELISNFEELTRLLRGTELERDLQCLETPCIPEATVPV
jgi:LPS sulfotransferase NodH